MVNLYRSYEDADSLSLNSRFSFRCHSGLSCFGQCCLQPTIILHPYDLIRLRRRLGMSSSQFLIRYTRQIIDEASHFPLVLLDLAHGGGCPFFQPEEGCTVYPERPAACRLFPVTQGSAWTPQGVEDFYFLKRLPYCRGFDAGQEWTVAAWRADQGMEPYQDLDREWQAILLTAGQNYLPRVDERGRELFFLAMYDVDEFRHLIRKSRLLRPFDLEPQSLEHLLKDDIALLRWGCQYLKKLFFLEEALTP